MTAQTFMDEIAAMRPATASGFHVPAGHRAPTIRSTFLQVMLGLYILISAFEVLTSLGYIWLLNGLVNGGFANQEDAANAGLLIDSATRIAAFALLGVFVLCIIGYLAFIYGVIRNLERANARGLQISAGGAVGWSFVPFANLVKIYQAMSEAWSSSHDPARGAKSTPAYLPIWWACYLGGNILAMISQYMQAPLLTAQEIDIGGLQTAFAIEIASSIVTIVSSVLLIMAVSSITRAQKEWRSAPAELAKVFEG